jgi:hypothetical protein
MRRTLNILNLLIAIFVFGTGLILLFQFHIGHGGHHKEWLGLAKVFWLIIHQISAIGFVIGFTVHIQLHWKYIKMVTKQWHLNLPKKLKSTTREQILLLIATLVVLWAGFYSWITMPGAALENETFHSWIDIHNRVGILFLIGMGVHIKRRWQRMYPFRRRHDVS